MTRPALVGDIGGTNARLALVTPGEYDLRNIQKLPCADYSTLTEAVQAYLEMVGGERPREACLAFACPVHHDVIKMTNNPWTFSKTAFKAEMGLNNFKAINDFTAQALGLPHIEDNDLHKLGGGISQEGCARLVVGPGTGLGVAGLAPSQRFWIPLSGEGGHASFAPTDDFEIELLKWFRRRYSRVSVERILCGQGIADLYQAHADLAGVAPKFATAADVTNAAIAGDPIALDTTMRFCKILGDVTGDMALTLGARGGVYLCGGILPRILELASKSDYRHAFENKGRMGTFTSEIATWVVTAQWTGLLGAAEALHNEEVA